MGPSAFVSGSGGLGARPAGASGGTASVCSRRSVIVALADPAAPKRRGRPKKDRTPKDEPMTSSNADVLDSFLSQFDGVEDSPATHPAAPGLDDLDFYAQAGAAGPGVEEDDPIDPDLDFDQAEVIDDQPPPSRPRRQGGRNVVAATGESTDFLLDMDMSESSAPHLDIPGDAADADESDDPFEDQVPESHRRRIKTASLFGFLDDDEDDDEAEEDDDDQEQDREPEQNEGSSPSPLAPSRRSTAVTATESPADTSAAEQSSPLDAIFGDEAEFASVRSSVLGSTVKAESSESTKPRKAMISDLIDVGNERSRSLLDKESAATAANTRSDRKKSLMDLKALDDNLDDDDIEEEEEEEDEPVTLDDYDEGDEEASVDSRLSKMSERNLGHVIFYNDDNHVSVTNRRNISLNDEGEEEMDVISIRDGQLLPELSSSNVPRSSKEWLGRRLFELSLDAGYQQMDAWSKRRAEAPSNMESLFPPEAPAPPKLGRITISSETSEEEDEAEGDGQLNSEEEGEEFRDFFRSKSNLSTENGVTRDTEVSFPCVYSFKAVGLGNNCSFSLLRDIERVLGRTLESNALFEEKSGKYMLVEIAALVHSPRDVTQVYDAIRENPTVKFSYG